MLPIHLYGSDILEKVCNDVDLNYDNLSYIIRKMFKTLTENLDLTKFWINNVSGDRWSTFLGESFGLSMGQILCAPMIIIGLTAVIIRQITSLNSNNN